jgi:hypothetical protein
MKRSIYGALMLLAAALLISVPMVQAQSQLKADVPFTFSVDKQSMSAGNYEIDYLNANVLVLRDLDTKHARLLMKSHDVQAANIRNAHLVFHKYDNEYFLTQIWKGDSSTGIELPMSRREKEIQMAGNSLPNGPELVIVAMK